MCLIFMINQFKLNETCDLTNIYPTIRRTSVDYAIIEKAEEVKFVPASFYWNDVGSFDALHEVLGKGNVSVGADLVQMNSKENIVYSDKTVALIDGQIQQLLMLCQFVQDILFRKFNFFRI